MKPITECRACSSKNLVEFLNLGEQYLADFRNDDTKPPKYPLAAVFCKGCKLVQLTHTTPQEQMYHSRYGFKSGVSDTIREDLDDAVTHAFQYINDPRSWLDIASNDGTLLSFIPFDVHRVGVDPVKFLCDEAKEYADEIICDYFTSDLFPAYEGDFDYQKFDVVTSISCFYDMPDPNKFVEDVMNVLAKRGVWVIQQNYLMTTLELSAVDNFCHEHIEYYTLFSLENLLTKYDLEVNEVLTSPVNGGSIRTIVSRKGTFPVDESVRRQREIEWDYGVEDIETYRQFADGIGEKIEKLRALVDGLKSEGKSIAILAASTRGSVIWQSAGLDGKQIDYAIERNPAKVGKIFSPLGIPIISEEEAHERNPDYMIVGPWFFLTEIVTREKEYLKQGGKLITPLPEVEVIDWAARSKLR